MSFKDIEIKITFEEDGRPKVSIAVIFKDADQMNDYLIKMKEIAEEVFKVKE